MDNETEKINNQLNKFFIQFCGTEKIEPLKVDSCNQCKQSNMCGLRQNVQYLFVGASQFRTLADTNEVMSATFENMAHKCKYYKE